MPTNIKIIVSILTIAVALAAAYFEHAAGNIHLQWVVIGLGLFMALSLWVFPEPKAGKDKS